MLCLSERLWPRHRLARTLGIHGKWHNLCGACCGEIRVISSDGCTAAADDDDDDDDSMKNSNNNSSSGTIRITSSSGSNTK